jgi:hypothetical protein
MEWASADIIGLKQLEGFAQPLFCSAFHSCAHRRNDMSTGLRTIWRIVHPKPSDIARPPRSLSTKSYDQRNARTRQLKMVRSKKKVPLGTFLLGADTSTSSIKPLFSWRRSQ